MPEPPEVTDECPNCGHPVTDAREVPAHPLRDVPARERATCRHCGLQVVRRPGEAWRGIRG